MPKWLAGITASIWVVFFGIDYWWHNSYYLRAIDRFPYTAPLLIIIGVVAVVAVLHRTRNGSWLPFQTIGWRGITWWGLLFLIQFILLASYVAYSEALAGPWTDYLLPFGRSILSTHLFLGATVWLAAGLGHFVTQIIGIRYAAPTQIWVNIGAGFGLMSLLLFGCSAVGLLYGWWPWLLLVALAAFQYKYLWAVLQQVLWHRVSAVSIHPVALLPIVAGLLLIGANLLGIHRPVPVGFDAVNFYMNIPHILADRGSLVEGGQPYNWSFVMSLGFLGWGSTRFALLLAILPGILSVGVLYQIGRLYLPQPLSILSAVLFYALPMVVWQSTQEAKVDLGLTFIGLVVLLAYLTPAEEKKRSYSLPLLLGFLLGIAVGIKFTALFIILGIGVAWLYKEMGMRAGIGGLLLSTGSLFVFGLYRFAPIPLQLGGSLVLGGLLMIGGFILCWPPRNMAFPFSAVWKPIGIMGVMVLLTFSPWLIKNGIETQSIGFKTLIAGQPLYPQLPALQQFDADDPQSQAIYWLGQPMLAQAGTLDLSRLSQAEVRKQQSLESGMYEEVARYMGYEPLLPRLLTIPYDMTMRNNVGSYVVDAGMWLWLLLPLLLLGYVRHHWSLYASVVVLWLFGGLAVYGGWSVVGYGNWDAAATLLAKGQGELVFPELFIPMNHALFALGQLVHAPLASISTKPIIAFLLFFFLFAFIVLLAYQQRQWGKGPIRSLLLFALAYFLLWWIMGSGIPWYGQLGFAISPMLVLYWLYQQRTYYRYLYYLGITILGISLLFSVLQRWHTPDPLNPQNQQFMVPLYVQYMAGEEDASEVYQSMYGKYDPALAVINAETTGKVLRFGTFINYYINNNTQRVFLDNQLNNFKYLYDHVDGDPDKLYDLLEQLDIRYIVMSLFVGDDTQEGLLAQKAQMLDGFIKALFYRDNPRIRLIYTDQQQQQRGTYAAYEILYYE